MISSPPTTSAHWGIASKLQSCRTYRAVARPRFRVEMLFGRHVRSHRGRDRSDHARCHLELDLAVGDAVAPRNSVEVRVRHPNLAVLLEHEQPHGPIEAGEGVGGDE